MKVLFVCKANVSRSQMAAAIYNRLTDSSDADSAGVVVDVPNETLGDRKRRLGGSNTLTVMEEAGFDITSSVRTQLTQGMLDSYDYVVSMCDQSVAPDWLKTNPHYIYWDIADPFNVDISVTRATRDKINRNVQDLIQRITKM